MRARLVLVPVALAAVLLTGCVTKAGQTTPTEAPDNGVSALSADEILAKAKTALGAATSFHLKGDITEDNVKSSVDLTYKGKDGKGSFSTGGTTFDVVKIGNDIYMKAPDDFWKQMIPAGQAQDAALLLLHGKWVKVDATNAQFSGFTTLFDTNEMIKPSGTLSKGDTGTTNGVPTIALAESDGSKLYIATRGEPLPVRIEGKPGDGGLDFSDYGAPVEITAPSSDQVFDLKQLLGG
jgi:hypothetical protein